MSTVTTVSFEGGSRRKDGLALAAGVLALVPPLLMLLAFFGGAKHEAVAADVGAGECSDLHKVRAVGHQIAFRWELGLLV